MMAEMGAKNSFVLPDEEVDQYLVGRAQRSYTPLFPDPGASYQQELNYNLSQLTPQVACPHSVDHVKPLSEVCGTHIDQAFIGTCTNGRLEDLQVAADILRGRRIAPGTRLIIIPASSEVYLAAVKLGLITDFLEAGAVVESPGCGPCMGNHLGIPAEGEVTISTANRNFRGRMGTKESEIYLANPYVVAAAAVAGEIIAPEDLI
jgi:homoaconitase/3-isopropylmalate dehydratase large subunit